FAWRSLGQSAVPVPSPDSSFDINLFARFIPALDGVRLAFLPVLVYVLWRHWTRRSRSTLERRIALREPHRREVYLTETEPYLFSGLDLHRPLQALRAHRRVDSTELDVGATLRATIASGGRVQLRYGSRPHLPDYLLLIDRASTHDHLAKLGELLSVRLRIEQIHFFHMEFNGDPRLARRSEGRAVSLADLATHHGEHPLLIVSDGEGLINPLSGTVQ